MLTALHYHLLPLIAALFPAYLLRFSIFNIPTNVLEVIIIVTAACGLSSTSVRRSWWHASRRLSRPIIMLVLAFLLAACISTVLSPHLITSLGILKSWISIPAVYAFMVFAAPLATSKYLQSLVFSALAVALYSFSALGQTSRLDAFYDTPNALALFLAPITTLVLYLALFKYPSRSWARFYLLSALVLFLALLGTQSVGALLAVSASSIVMVMLTRIPTHNRRLLRTGFIILLIVGFIISIPKIHYLLQPTSSAYVRLQLWSVSLDLMNQHPFTGIGLGTFEPAYQQQLHHRFQAFETCLLANQECLAPLPEFVFRDPHNWPLAFYLNLGPLGFLAFLGLNYLALSYGITSKASPLQRALTASLLTILLHGLIDTIYWKNDLALLWWLLLALSIRAATAPAAKPVLESPPQTAD